MMKKKHLIKTAALLILCCAIFGCKKQNVEPEPQNTTTTIYGTVFNSVTHEPVIGAEIEIGQNDHIPQYQYFGSNYNEKISSSVSGSDGQFELQFGELAEYQDFYIAASCNGYNHYYSKTNFGIGGGIFRVDINLDPY
jgi:hypothetical protein